MAAVDVVVLVFHLSGVAIVGLAAWALKGSFRASPDEPHGGGGGSRRIGPPRPPWSWHPRGGRASGRRTRAARRPAGLHHRR